MFLNSLVSKVSEKMARSKENTRLKIINAAYEEFYQKGFGRSGVEEISIKAGISKRALYDHFESKDLLMEAVLDAQNVIMLDLMRRWIPQGASTPEQLINAIFDKFEKWVSQPEWLGSGFSRAALELADLPGHPARHAASRHKTALEDWLGNEMEKLDVEKAKEYAQQIMIIIEGAQTLALIHQNAEYLANARLAALSVIRAG